jgi:hypothetical protein
MSQTQVVLTTGRAAADRAVRHALDGAERVALLPRAAFIAVAPGSTDKDEPPYVFIGWTRDAVERPYPGTTIWRAVLERYLDAPHPDDPGHAIVRTLVGDALARFPSLDAWLWWSDHGCHRTTRRVEPERTPTAGTAQVCRLHCDSLRHVSG